MSHAFFLGDKPSGNAWHSEILYQRISGLHQLSPVGYTPTHDTYIATDTLRNRTYDYNKQSLTVTEQGNIPGPRKLTDGYCNSTILLKKVGQSYSMLWFLLQAPWWTHYKTAEKISDNKKLSLSV